MRRRHGDPSRRGAAVRPVTNKAISRIDAPNRGGASKADTHWRLLTTPAITATWPSPPAHMPQPNAPLHRSLGSRWRIVPHAPDEPSARSGASHTHAIRRWRIETERRRKMPRPERIQIARLGYRNVMRARNRSVRSSDSTTAVAANCVAARTIVSLPFADCRQAWSCGAAIIATPASVAMMSMNGILSSFAAWQTGICRPIC
jgi:hypothetical protein